MYLPSNAFVLKGLHSRPTAYSHEKRLKQNAFFFFFLRQIYCLKSHEFF